MGLGSTFRLENILSQNSKDGEPERLNFTFTLKTFKKLIKDNQVFA